MNSSYETPASCGTNLFETFEKRLQQPASSQTFFCFIIIINIITFPVTVVLNALVMIAVKTKSRLRATKSNILLALLASTDFLVGAAIQPPFIAVIILLISDQPIGYCLLKVSHACIVKSDHSVSVPPGFDKWREISCYETPFCVHKYCR